MNYKSAISHPASIILMTNLFLVMISFVGQSSDFFWSASTIYKFLPAPYYYFEFTILSFLIAFFCFFWELLISFNKYRYSTGNFQSELKFPTVTNHVTFYRFVFALFLLFTIFKTYVMSGAGFLDIIAGNASAADIEQKLDEAPFGLNGIVLQFALLQLLIWRFISLSGQKSRILKFGIALATFAFVAHGKAQGLMYVAAVHISNATSRAKMIVRAGIYFIIVLLFFILSRLVRNQDSSLALSTEWAFSTVFGNYFGAPFINGAFMRDEYNPAYAYRYFSYLLPRKLLPEDIKYSVGLPDPTSPSGLIGGLFGFENWSSRIIVLAGISLVVVVINRWSIRSPAGSLFRPFFILAVLTNTMYNHFLNFALFWLPLCMALMLGALSEAATRRTVRSKALNRA